MTQLHFASADRPATGEDDAVRLEVETAARS
jgi:hypothetical protein